MSDFIIFRLSFNIFLLIVGFAWFVYSLVQVIQHIKDNERTGWFVSVIGWMLLSFDLAIKIVLMVV